MLTGFWKALSIFTSPALPLYLVSGFPLHAWNFSEGDLRSWRACHGVENLCRSLHYACAFGEVHTLSLCPMPFVTINILQAITQGNAVGSHLQEARGLSWVRAHVVLEGTSH